ncbi:MAG: ATP-binding cassette domain-containing protein [Candidatus Syntrophosphaera sp.]
MVKVKNLCLSLAGNSIIRDISFVLEDAQNLIILGRSGAGKTILIKTLMGMFPPDSGTVSVDGIDVYNGPNHQRDIVRHKFSMVFQNAALLDSFNVFQNVALPLYERAGISYSEALERVEKSLAVVGLEGTLEKYPSELSGGMRKRVAIARALVYEPQYIIFDEPVSGLDPITANEVLYYISHIINSYQATTITITHDIRNLNDLGNCVLFIENGEAVFYGSIDDMRLCKDPLLKQFIGVGDASAQ